MVMSIEEAAYFLRSEYGLEYNDQAVTGEMVANWVEQGQIKAKGTYPLTIEQKELEEFVEDCQWEGTAYEKGIDDQTKIERLLEEVMELRLENKRLKQKNTEYALKLGIGDF